MENARAPLLQRVKADEAKGAWYVVPTVLLLYVTFTSLLAFAPAAELVDGWFMQAVALIHKYSRDQVRHQDYCSQQQAPLSWGNASSTAGVRSRLTCSCMPANELLQTLWLEKSSSS